MKPITKPVAAVCDVCGYIEMPAADGLLHCRAPMRPITRAELKKLDANNLPRSFR